MVEMISLEHGQAICNRIVIEIVQMYFCIHENQLSCRKLNAESN